MQMGFKGITKYIQEEKKEVFNQKLIYYNMKWYLKRVTNKRQKYAFREAGKERAWAIIKSLIMLDRNVCAWGALF